MLCCYEGFCSSSPAASTLTRTSRHNNSNHATLDTSEIFDEGAFRFVYQGVYDSGARKGERCVAKQFKQGSVYETHYFDADIKTVDMAMMIIEEWNRGDYINKMVVVNAPEIWALQRGPMAGAKLLVEPYIQNYEKLNSNSGWNESGFSWARAMQALSHFSYHITDGACLLCDLQGGFYKNGIVLTDPAIISSNEDGTYGPTDLGPTGISSFFSRHRCNEYCSKDWIVPRDRNRYHHRNKGTSMIHVSTQYDRNAMSPRHA